MYYVYILSNKVSWVLYVWVTNNLIRRIFEHKYKSIEGFTKRYSVNNLVYYEEYSDVMMAISREKEIKHRNRIWKIRLIEKNNPLREDLCSVFLE